MIVSRELVYSNDLCSAFLTSVVKAFEANQPNTYLGRTAMQKLAYFVKVLGVPIPCSFGIYTYGPYSDTVTFSVESLLADEVILDSSTNPKYSNYRLGRNANELLSAFSDELRPYQGEIERTVKALGSFAPNELELIATLHFIAQRQSQTGIKASKDSVILEFKTIKHEKFNDYEINGWYDALVRAGLIPGDQPAQAGS